MKARASLPKSSFASRFWAKRPLSSWAQLRLEGLENRLVPSGDLDPMIGFQNIQSMGQAVAAEQSAFISPTEAEILGLFQRWSSAVQTGNPDIVTALYAPDAILVPTLSNVIRNTPEAIHEYFVEFLAKNPVPRLDSYNIVSNGQIADNSGLYTFGFSPQNRAFFAVAARYTFSYQKTDGEWLIIQHHSSQLPFPDKSVTGQIQVSALYKEILQRTPDKSGLEFFSQSIANGLSPTVVAQAIWNSPEHRAKQVDAYFQDFLDRQPEPSAKAAFLNAFAQGNTSSGIQVAILTSEEFINHSKTQEEYIKDLYLTLLDRESDPAGLASHRESLNRFGPVAVVESFFRADEYLRLQVNGYYQKFLRRDGIDDPAGLQNWVSAARAGWSLDQIGQLISSSPEVWPKWINSSANFSPDSPEMPYVTTINGMPPPYSPRDVFFQTVLFHETAENGDELFAIYGVRSPQTRARIHYHDYGGTAFILEGEMTLYHEGMEPITASAGQSYYMGSGSPMAGVNSGDVDAVFLDCFRLPIGRVLWRPVEPYPSH